MSAAASSRASLLARAAPSRDTRRVPTIATSVPRGAFAWVTKKMKQEVRIPLVTSNRINLPSIAEQILADWPLVVQQFVKVMPTDYKRVLEEQKKKAAAA